MNIRRIVKLFEDTDSVKELPRVWDALPKNINFQNAVVDEWPPCSPDLTPLDFFLWGYVKERVFQEIRTTREDMMERIQQAFAAIRRETLRNVRRSFYSRIEMC
jgi:hypothetical protein